MDSYVKLFIIKQFILLGVNLGLQFLIGTLVLKKNLLVNYSRKIMHFLAFFTPMVLEVIIEMEQVYSVLGFILGLVIYLITMIIYIKPIREKSWIVARMYMCFDRPEDRPHTLLWLVTQVAVGYVVMVPWVIYFQNSGYLALAIIPILVNAIGDGLAEPIGVRFGKHKYQVRALFTSKRYTRSIEGSACVFIVSLLLIVLFRNYFTPTQFYAVLLMLPLGSTLAEAFSPHTWDTPLIFMVGYLALYIGMMI